MDKIVLKTNLNEQQKEEFAQMAYKAFEKKLRFFWLHSKTEKQAKEFLLNAHFQRGLYAFINDSLVGFAALEQKGKSFYKHDVKILADIFGVPGGLWRSLYFAILHLASRRLKNKEIKIEMIVVDEQYRGLGIGKKLFSEIISQALAKNYESIYLEVVDTNPKAYKLYRQLGFTTIKTYQFEKVFENAGFTKAYLMRKDLRHNASKI